MYSLTIDAGDNIEHGNTNNSRKDLLVQAGQFLVATGSSNAFVLEIDDNVDSGNSEQAITSIVDGHLFRFKSNMDLTSVQSNSPTLTIKKASDSSTIVTAPLVYGNGVKLPNLSIKDGSIVSCSYDGTVFQVVSCVMVDPNFYGDGSDGALTVVNGQTYSLTPNQIYNFTSVTINSGGKLNATGGGVVMIKVQGNFTNNGEVDFSNIGTDLISQKISVAGMYVDTPIVRTAGNGGDGGGAHVGYPDHAATKGSGATASTSMLYGGGGGGGAGAVNSTYQTITGGNGGNGGVGGISPTGGTGGTTGSINGGAGTNSGGGGGGKGNASNYDTPGTGGNGSRKHS